MQYDFNAGAGTLTLRRPSKPVNMSAPDATELYLHIGEGEEQYQSFIEVVSNLAQAFKFLPKADQMRYRYGNPLLQYSNNPEVTRDYVASLVEDMDQTQKDYYTGLCETLITSTDQAARLEAAAKLKELSDGFLLRTFSKQGEPTKGWFISLSDVNSKTYDLGKKKIIEGSVKVSINGVLIDNTAYDIDSANGTITFHDGVIADSLSNISVDFSFMSPKVILGEGIGAGYSNLEFSPGASEWDLLEGVNSSDSSMFDEINEYFSWSAIRSIGGSSSYYEIAKSGSIDSADFSDLDAFNLMCSMLESRERVFGELGGIFLGDEAVLNEDPNVVIENISSWLESYTDVDPHNIGILKMFFGMQTDLINTLDAYINCQTYWGGDLSTQVLTGEFGSFGDTLKAKVESYIATLDGEKRSAAEDMKALWFHTSPRFDKAGDKWTGELKTEEGSWVEFFSSTMDKFTTEEVFRIIICRIMNRTQERDYKKDKAEYETKKEDLMLEEIFLQRISAKKAGESKKSFKKLLSRRSNVSRVLKSRKSGAKKGVSRPAPKPRPRPAARTAPAVSRHAPNVRVAPAARPAGAPIASAAPKAHNQGQKKQDRKVI